jgi:hypothetical protein
MGGQIFVLDPAVDRLLDDPEVFRDLVDRDPGFGHQAFLPSKRERQVFGDYRQECSRGILPSMRWVVKSCLQPGIIGKS